MNYDRLARFFALAAGLLDFGSGVGLALAPAKVLPLLRMPAPTAEALVYLRFVGAFVTAVGVSYLLALVLGGIGRLCAVFEFTLVFRFATGIFVAIAVARDWLAFPWASVIATDFALIGIQLWLLPKLQNPHVASSSSSPSPF
jgi:hypothetical protein